VILNILFPTWLVIVPLCLLLAFTTYKTYNKGLVILAKERAAALKERDSTADSVPLVLMGQDAATPRLSTTEDLDPEQAMAAR
jgi:hypothetical protein